MKGIVLAGGSGTRLHPITKAISKQLIPVYDKPMVYYPLSVLMLSGIKDILLISTRQDLPQYRQLLGDGSDFGISITYAEQPRPEGLAQAFTIGREFIDGQPVCLILGDNIFYGHGLTELLRDAAGLHTDAKIFAYWVKEPQRYGVVEFDARHRAIGLEEKPANPRSQYAVTGIYFYGPDVCDLAGSLRPSARGEYEITDLNRLYLDQGRLQVEVLGRGVAWLDTGTHQSLLQASNFVEAIESRQGLKVACLEEIALRNGWIDEARLRSIAELMGRSDYSTYLLEILRQTQRFVRQSP